MTHHFLNLFYFSYVDYRWQKHMQEMKPTYWLLVYRDSGTLEIYSMPDLRLSYLIRNFGYGQYVLHDSMESTSLHSTQVNEIPNREMQVQYTYNSFLSIIFITDFAICVSGTRDIDGSSWPPRKQTHAAHSSGH